MEYTKEELERARREVDKAYSFSDHNYRGIAIELQALANRQATEIAELKRERAEVDADTDKRLAEVLGEMAAMKAEKDAVIAAQAERLREARGLLENTYHWTDKKRDQWTAISAWLAVSDTQEAGE